MATNKGALTLIQDLVEELQGSQTTAAKKSNTVTSAIGTVVTALIAGATYWIQTGSAAPAWLPAAVAIVGMLATTFGISKTKNGITDSVAVKLQDALSERIDLKHNHELDTVALPRVQFSERDLVNNAVALRAEADAVIANYNDYV